MREKELKVSSLFASRRTFAAHLAVACLSEKHYLALSVHQRYAAARWAAPSHETMTYSSIAAAELRAYELDKHEELLPGTFSRVGLADVAIAAVCWMLMRFPVSACMHDGAHTPTTYNRASEWMEA